MLHKPIVDLSGINIGGYLPQIIKGKELNELNIGRSFLSNIYIYILVDPGTLVGIN